MNQSMTKQIAVAIAALLGLTGVAAGAFGAHGLRESLSEEMLEIWRTGAHYQQIHAVAALAVALPEGFDRGRATAVVLFAGGIIVFAGTLYALALGGPRILGAVTPLGGLALMAGWAAVGVSSWRSSKTH